MKQQVLALCIMMIWPWFVSGQGISKISIPPIHQAAYNGDIEEVVRLIVANPKAIEALDIHGFNALFPAIAGKQYAVIELLIAHGIEVNIVAKEQRLAPIHLAVSYEGGDWRCVKLLLDHGANPNSAGEISIKQEIEQDGVLQKDVLVLRNITPLMLSVIMADNAEVVKELLRHRASRNSRDSITHRTALEWAEYVDSTKDTNPDKDRTKVISILKASKSVRHSRR